jgi:molybdopterin-guanine dinucleotide biosynthesis protein A
VKPTFSAALLAGGQSSRMGRDKALLPVAGANCVMGQRQLDVLRDLEPAAIFWSGQPRHGLPEDVHVVSDEIENLGPLAGISACLNRCESDLLVVLAIDLPRMSATYLRSLLAQCSSARGVVVQHDEFFEPLAAVYPKSMRELALEHLHQKQLALQALMREAVKRKLLNVVSLDENDVPLFKNVNTPDDLEDE